MFSTTIHLKMNPLRYTGEFRNSLPQLFFSLGRPPLFVVVQSHILLDQHRPIMLEDMHV